jgi:hypothetical protein
MKPDKGEPVVLGPLAAAGPQWPVADRIELGEFGVDLDVDRAVVVDVLTVRRGDGG